MESQEMKEARLRQQKRLDEYLKVLSKGFEEVVKGIV